MEDFESALAEGAAAGFEAFADEADFFGEAIALAFDWLRLALLGAGAVAAFFSGLVVGFIVTDFLGEGALT